LLHDGQIDFHGTYYNAEHCVLHPRLNRQVPLMVGSNGPRMLSITLPHVRSWNIWWSTFGNTAAGFAQAKAEVDTALAAAGRNGQVEATCAVYVQIGAGGGRLMGHANDAVKPLLGSPLELADQLREFAAAGASHVQLVVDPITRDSIESLADVLIELDEG
jgi:alkanesulfonate monooxygenase SsuD/methylene tetrahydromethanopterin reductase-like flavin-dependent oxidoreductase (luciferase family)